MNKIQKILNSCFNLITGLAPTPNTFNKEKMLRLQDLIQLENRKLGYQLDKNLLPLTTNYSGQTVETKHCKKTISIIQGINTYPTSQM